MFLQFKHSFNIPLIFTIFKQYILYSFKKLFNYKKFFKEFDDLKYYKSNKKNGFYGQKGDLYKGTNFGTLNEANKTKDPTVPF